MQRSDSSEDGCDKRRFRSFNDSTCKTVLNLLEAVYLRFRKIVVERVTVVKFRVDNRGSDGTGSFSRALSVKHNAASLCSTYTGRHCHCRFHFRAKIQMKNDNCEEDGENTDTDHEHEIYHCVHITHKYHAQHIQRE